jgi:peroxiredoxin
MSISVGDAAPDFTLKDTEGNDVTLSSFAGKESVTLVFHPFAFTGVCEGELCEIRDNLASFNGVENQVLVINCNARHANGVWGEQQGFDFPILSDFWPHGATATAYECFNADLGAAMRRTVIIGNDGKIADIFDSGGLGEARGFDNYTAGLAKL